MFGLVSKDLKPHELTLCSKNTTDERRARRPAAAAAAAVGYLKDSRPWSQC